MYACVCVCKQVPPSVVPVRILISRIYSLCSVNCFLEFLCFGLAEFGASHGLVLFKPFRCVYFRIWGYLLTCLRILNCLACLWWWMKNDLLQYGTRELPEALPPQAASLCCSGCWCWLGPSRKRSVEHAVLWQVSLFITLKGALLCLPHSWFALTDLQTAPLCNGFLLAL